MKILTLLITLAISLAVNAKVIHLVCHGLITTPVTIDTNKKILIPADGDYHINKRMDWDKYPKYGRKLPVYLLMITNDEYIGTRALPNSEYGANRIHTYIVNRKDLSYKWRRTPSDEEKSNYGQKFLDRLTILGEVEVSGQCKIKPKNLI
jgi:hypothetical protein